MAQFASLLRTPAALVAAAVLAGAAAGVGGYTMVYARGYSYLTNDPAACANCHIMREQYDGWLKSSHRAVAVCNDCHTPHALLPKYWVKATNGMKHSYYFTTQRFPEPIRITPGSRAVTEGACRRCHAGLAQAMGGSDVSCLRCHGSVGHFELAATSAVPHRGDE